MTSEAFLAVRRLEGVELNTALMREECPDLLFVFDLFDTLREQYGRDKALRRQITDLVGEIEGYQMEIADRDETIEELKS